MEALGDQKKLAKQLKGFLNKEEVTNSKDIGELEKMMMRQLMEMRRSGVTEDCSVCLDDLQTPVITSCSHVFCKACIERVLETIKPPTCPLCRNKIKKNDLLEAGRAGQ